MEVVLTGIKPYDGRYRLDLENEELTTREWGWVKRLAGYLPMGLDAAAAGGDPEFVCVLAVIALRRNGKIEPGDVPDVFDRLIDAPFGSTLTLEVDDEPEEADASPPVRSSNGNEPISGTASRTSSETSEPNPPASGTRGWAISQSGPLTSAS